MITITGKQLRQNLNQVVTDVFSGQVYQLSLGRGKKAKKIRLSTDKTVSQKQKIFNFLNSDRFVNSSIPPALQNYEDFKSFHEENFRK